MDSSSEETESQQMRRAISKYYTDLGLIVGFSLLGLTLALFMLSVVIINIVEMRNH